jgi:hypothetical protein
MSHCSFRAAPSFALVFGLLLGVARAQSPVLVVDVTHPPPSPGVDYAQISQAVAAAADGTIILVHSGLYLPFDVTSKALSIVAQGEVQVDGAISVHALAADQSVVLRGLQAHSVSTAPGLLLDGCAGPVWVEACTLVGGTGGSGPDGLLAKTCLAVTLVRCTLTGGEGIPGGQFASPSGAPALHVLGSLVSAWDLTATGGSGWYGYDNGGYGGDGARSDEGSKLRVIGGEYTGGAGLGGDSHYDFFCGCEVCYLGGQAGTGIVAIGNSLIEVSDAILRGGPGLYNPESFCLGSDGYSLNYYGGGLVKQYMSPLHTLRLSATAPEGGTLDAAIIGQPGEAALVLAAPAQDYLPLPYGTLSVAPQLAFVIGALPPSGEQLLSIHVPELGPGIEALKLVAQPLFQVSGVKLLGSPSATVLLDSQF